MNYIIFMIISFLQPICWPLPEMSTILYGILTVGPMATFVLGYMFILLGILFMYKITFFLSEKYLDKFKNKKSFKNFQKYLLNNEIITIGLLFILPVLPDEVICIGAAIVGIKFRIFMTIAAFSKIISIGSVILSSLLASVVLIHPVFLIGIQFLIILLISFAYKNVKLRK